MQGHIHTQDNYEDRIRGMCLEMCPRNERHTREKEGLLHKFEFLESSGEVEKPLPDFERKKRNRNFRAFHQADVQKTVKSFARSAAGMDKTIPTDLRPPYVLIQTVEYLCTKILVIDEPFHIIYDFMFDRLRSVRQDLVIQRIQDNIAIKIMEPIIRFHVYAAYRLRNESISNFDPHINKKHLVDCLKRLINLYEVNNYWGASRMEFETLYCLVAPNSFDVISRAISIRRMLNEKVFDSAIEVCLAYQARNYVKFFRLINDFPPLISTYLVQHVKSMRIAAFEIMSSAYGTKTCKYPVKHIMSILSYSDRLQPLDDLRHLKIDVIMDDTKQYYAKFCKTSSTTFANEQIEALNFDMNGPNRGIEEAEYVNYVSKLIWQSK